MLRQRRACISEGDIACVFAVGSGDRVVVASDGDQGEGSE